ncbi:MAG: hypothetical protein OEZ32_11835, partial [Nitrospinota bacterium]|nr:hypothetical protein [Nitrospinota bacterium]
MDDYLLFLAGVAMAAIIVFFMREIAPPTHRSSWEPVTKRDGGVNRRFSGSQGEVFTPKVLVIEFDEMGPGLQVNGEYHNPFERTEVDMVAAEVNSGGVSMEMVCVDEGEDEHELSDKYIGDLVNLSSATWLE